MRPLDSQLLQVWEQGYGRPPAEQAVVLLSACDLNLEPLALLELSVGERDRHLLKLRQMLFGDQLVATSACPGCNAILEVDATISELMLDGPPNRSQFSVEHDAWRISGRVPSTGDLLAVQRLLTERRRPALLSRCINTIEGAPSLAADSTVEQLPQQVVEAVVEAMALSDPQANLEFELRCGECEHGWQAPFDVVVFLWKELNDWAQRTLLQIHTLAKAYGWSEHETLQLSHWRRQVYLAMARQ